VSGSTLPTGAWPVMLTPFNENRSIDWGALDAYTDWLIELGSAGLFAVALSSEMYDLSRDERLELSARVVERAAGRVPVVASSAVSGSADEQAHEVRRVAETGVTAVVLISSLVARNDEPESVWLANIDTILSANLGVDFGIYECPLPYKRLPSIDAIRNLARSGRFSFYKDTSHSLDVMTGRIDVMRGTRLRLYNAAIGSLTPSLRAGASGLSGYAANLYPDLVSWLCDNLDDPRALAVQRLLTVVEHSVNLRYPASAKYLLDRSSRLEFRAISRWKPEVIGDHEGLPLQHLADYVRDLDLPEAALSRGR